MKKAFVILLILILVSCGSAPDVSEKGCELTHDLPSPYEGYIGELVSVAEDDQGTYLIQVNGYDGVYSFFSKDSLDDWTSGDTISVTYLPKEGKEYNGNIIETEFLTGDYSRNFRVTNFLESEPESVTVTVYCRDKDDYDEILSSVRTTEDKEEISKLIDAFQEIVFYENDPEVPYVSSASIEMRVITADHEEIVFTQYGPVIEISGKAYFIPDNYKHSLMDVWEALQ